MAKKKPKHRSSSRRNPSRKGKGRHPRRRRNPSGDFGSRLGRLALGATVAVGSAVAVTYLTSKIAPGQAASLYGIPIAVFVGGVALARKFPLVGAGIAIGAPAPFAIPLAARLLTATPSANAAQTAAGISRAYRTMRAVDVGRGMNAVSMRGVHVAAGY